MRRFNSYINGERENKFDPNAEVKVLNDEDVRIADGKLDFEDYIKIIEIEASVLKSFRTFWLTYYLLIHFIYSY